jgi:hypothetical protein
MKGAARGGLLTMLRPWSAPCGPEMGMSSFWGRRLVSRFDRTRALVIGVGVTISVFAASGCGGATQRQGGPFAGDARSATYLIDGKPVQLVAGRATTPGEGGDDVTMLTDGKLEGDLNDDGVTDLVTVVARELATGTAAFYITALVSDGTTYRAVSALPLGEKLVVKGLAFEGPEIKLRLVVRDPSNADPKPSKIVERRFTFLRGKLLAIKHEE